MSSPAKILPISLPFPLQGEGTGEGELVAAVSRGPLTRSLSPDGERGFRKAPSSWTGEGKAEDRQS